METFGILDYSICAMMLLISTTIGIYFGCFGSKQRSGKEYLYGKGNANVIPVGLSIFSSTVSGISIMGTPVEVYVFGTQFITSIFGVLLSLFITCTFIIPVFCGSLKINSPYEYLELRFSKKVRILSSSIYILSNLLCTPISLFASTLAFSEATEIPLAVCTSVVGGVCIIYTMLGGFSSVIWTDTVQMLLMFSSCVFVMYSSVKKVGTINEVWHRSEQGNRIEFFNMDPNPFVRLSFWSTTLGMSFNFAAHSGCSTISIQRYMSLANGTKAKITSIIGAVSFAIIVVISGVIGLSMYAFYYKCDPVENGDIPNTNQLLTYFLKNILDKVPGFSGFFIAGLLCAGLSTLSAELNTVSGVIYYDFVQNMFKNKPNKYKDAFIMKTIALCIGIFYLVAAPLFQYFEYIFQSAVIFGSIVYGANLGSLLLGTTFPKVHSLGAICGSLTSLVFSAWIGIGSFYYNVAKAYVLPVSTINCSNFTDDNNTNKTLINLSLSSTSEPFILYKISFLYITLIGTFITLSIGSLVSYVVERDRKQLPDANLLIPYYRTRGYNVSNTQLEEYS